MTQDARILVPTDGSKRSLCVLPWLRVIAEAIPEANFEILRCVEGSHDSIDDHEGIWNDFDEARLARTTVRGGRPIHQILERSHGFDMVVMASKGRGVLGRWLWGGVTTRVARECEVPVMVIGGSCDPDAADSPPNLKRILVALDNSPEAERTLFQAARLAERFGSTLHLHQRVSPPVLPDRGALIAQNADLLAVVAHWRRKCATLGKIRTRLAFRQSAYSPGILEYADEISAGLVVMGRRQEEPFWALSAGIIQDVMRQARCPVLVTL